VDAVHTLWAQVLNWLAPPLRVGLFLFLASALFVKSGPALLRFAGRTIAVGAIPAVGLLTYPEYLATSLCRRFGWRLLPGTFTYGQLLGTLATGLGRLGLWLRSLGQHRLAVPRKTLLVVVGALLAVWFTKAESLPLSLQPTVTAVRADLAQFDCWLVTGQSVPPGTTGTNECP